MRFMSFVWTLAPSFMDWENGPIKFVSFWSVALSVVVKMQKLRLCDFTWTYITYRIPPWPLTFCKYKFAKLGLGAFAGLSSYATIADHHLECCVWVIKYISRNARDPRQRSQRAASLTTTKTRYKLFSVSARVASLAFAHVGWVSRAFAYSDVVECA